MQETNPWEAIYNNLRGTKNVIRCSMDCKVDKLILVSTDKAVRPTNIMGPTKRICEMLAASVKEDQEVFFVMITDHPAIDSAVNAIKEGAFDYITKPFHMDEMRMKVERALSVKKTEASLKKVFEIDNFLPCT